MYVAEVYARLSTPAPTRSFDPLHTKRRLLFSNNCCCFCFKTYRVAALPRCRCRVHICVISHHSCSRIRVPRVHTRQWLRIRVLRQLTLRERTENVSEESCKGREFQHYWDFIFAVTVTASEARAALHIFVVADDGPHGKKHGVCRKSNRARAPNLLTSACLLCLVRTFARPCNKRSSHFSVQLLTLSQHTTHDTE